MNRLTEEQLAQWEAMAKTAAAGHNLMVNEDGRPAMISVELGKNAIPALVAEARLLREDNDQAHDTVIEFGCEIDAL